MVEPKRQVVLTEISPDGKMPYCQCVHKKNLVRELSWTTVGIYVLDRNLWWITNLSSLTVHHKNCQNNQGGLAGRSHNHCAETSLRNTCHVSAHLDSERLKESLFPTPTQLVLGVWQGFHGFPNTQSLTSIKIKQGIHRKATKRRKVISKEWHFTYKHS